MESCPGGDVDIEIRMVHPVEPPEKRKPVKKNVLDINEKIKEDNCRKTFCPCRQWCNL